MILRKDKIGTNQAARPLAGAGGRSRTLPSVEGGREKIHRAVKIRCAIDLLAVEEVVLVILRERIHLAQPGSLAGFFF